MFMQLLPFTVRTCGQPSSPGANGQVSVGLTTIGNTANYSCDFGYELLPDISVRLCQEDGMWSGVDPFCQCMFYYWSHIDVDSESFCAVQLMVPFGL